MRSREPCVMRFRRGWTQSDRGLTHFTAGLGRAGSRNNLSSVQVNRNALPFVQMGKVYRSHLADGNDILLNEFHSM